ncbi:hypothetical protein TVNIR_3586 [Thioalkalivibrio nitratireducens DSM 14787]|uniref:T6SS Phospholipase effector Tle1-like catalytic domain-containing protein n=1 Tax=Thioalkalivibrio nitratireducens (strain DSM 14787 / UNIQEM 213 / ALEN2) TaxID=1255043 RepID=L0E3I6_THIND|nr:hypothetical protein TVNIR_3586 [Thioalkalivibrio nitratireducens DSM 14787]
MYGFLVRNWEPGDRILLFGFSRGAFTVRLLAGLITRCGILDFSHYDSEVELNQRIRGAYCAYRRSHFHPQFTERFCLRHARKLQPDAPENDVDARRPPIRFVGVWDTVDAMGVPFDELRDAIDLVIEYSFRDRILSRRVMHGCHALAIDDARKTFHPVMWDERLEPAGDGRIEQVWFAGMHSNVGGGYPKSQMASVALRWMVERVTDVDAVPEAEDHRLRFHPGAIEAIRQDADVHGQLYDSRSGLAAFYRYAPRPLEEIRREYTTGDVRLHPTVWERIAQGTDLYSPHNLGAKVQDAPSLTGTHAWQTAMRHCHSVTRLRQLLYFLLLPLTLALALFFLPPGVANLLAILAGSDAFRHLPVAESWFFSKQHLWAHGAAIVVLIGVLVGVRQFLKGRQDALASAGWASIPDFAQARPKGREILVWASRSSWLAVGRFLARLSASGVPDLIRAFFVRLFALVLYLPLKVGSWLHCRFCFRDLDVSALADPLHLDPGEIRTVHLETRDYLCPTGIELKLGEHYRVRVVDWKGWFDARFRATPDGLEQDETSLPGIMRRSRFLRRRPDQPLLRLLAGVGRGRPIDIGSEETFVSPRTAMLRLFVNDVALFPGFPLWGMRDLFYSNNQGIAMITVERISRESEVE